MIIVIEPISIVALVMPEIIEDQQFTMTYNMNMIRKGSEEYVYEIEILVNKYKGSPVDAPSWRIWRYGAYHNGQLYRVDRPLKNDEIRLLINLVRDEGLSPYEALEFMEL